MAIAGANGRHGGFAHPLRPEGSPRAGPFNDESLEILALGHIQERDELVIDQIRIQDDTRLLVNHELLGAHPPVGHDQSQVDLVFNDHRD